MYARLSDPSQCRVFPLGSDPFGRDLLSRLLWGIAPTLLLVLPVALVRLVLGISIGLAAGFSEGRRGRFLDTLISGALAIPVLLVALGRDCPGGRTAWAGGFHLWPGVEWVGGDGPVCPGTDPLIKQQPYRKRRAPWAVRRWICFSGMCCARLCRLCG